MNRIDLSGIWNCGGKDFYLPGTSCENKIGAPAEKPLHMDAETVRTLSPKYAFVGEMELERKIIIPKEWDNKRVELFLERVNIASTVSVDGVVCTRQHIGLSSPHRHTLRLSEGEHTISLRIDNSDLLGFSNMSSGFSRDTQSEWWGAVGRIELVLLDEYYIDKIRVFEIDEGIKVAVSVNTECRTPSARQDVTVHMTVGEKKISYPITADNRRQTLWLEFPIDKKLPWNEFEKNLYTLVCEYEVEGVIRDTKETVFGFGALKTEGRRFISGSREVKLRGTTDCAIHPKTGYPPTDFEYWQDYMSVIRDYGLNYVRFHSWCPPEAAFRAADEAGVYVSIELPFWTNFDVTPLDCGHDTAHRVFFIEEARRILDEFGNHPCFVLFSCGNELLGDFSLLEEMTTMLKAYDPRRLYTLTSNFDRRTTPADDYFVAFNSGQVSIRCQHYHSRLADNTRLEFSEGVTKQNIPVISFEIGQYAVYPDILNTEIFDGNLLPYNFEVIADALKKRGHYKKAAKYIEASGAFAGLLYKEEVEAALRTNEMSGFGLLSLTDYTGQCTATVGILDVFRNSKGIMTNTEFKRFCSERVPLIKTERVFKIGDMMNIELDLYDYAENPYSGSLRLEFFDGDRLLKSIETNEKKLSVKLDFADKSAKLEIRLSAGNAQNSEYIWVFPEFEPNFKFDTIEEALDKIENGGRAVVSIADLKDPIKGAFYPVFWSPAFFETKKPCGIFTDTKCPVFDSFPVGEFSEFVWKKPLEKSMLCDITALGEDFPTIVEAVPNFYDNTPMSALFEAKIGKAKVLFCGFSIEAESLEERALIQSIADYSEVFEPKCEIDKETFIKMIKE